MMVFQGRAPLTLKTTVEFAAVYPEDGEAYWVVQLWQPNGMSIDCYMGQDKAVAQAIYDKLTAA